MSRAPTAVKFCGFKEPDDALRAIDLGVQFIGLNFCPASPRALSLDQATRIVSAAGASATCVGIFVDARREDISRTIDTTGIGAIQLHGSEPPDLCTGWKGTVVIKAFRIDGHGSATPPFAPYAGAVRYILADHYSPDAHGGTGGRVDLSVLWRAVPQAEARRMFLAGGLTAESVEDAVRTVRPFAVDTASGIEDGTPGRKSIEKMARFMNAVRRADAQGES